MIPAETIPEIGAREDKEHGGGEWFQVLYIWYVVRTFVNATMYPHPAQNEKKMLEIKNVI
jgi:hypothetical protein